VIAGYLWLVFGWLLVKPNLDKRPDDQLAAALYDLGQDIGRVGVAVAVSVAAYLNGAVSQELSSKLVPMSARMMGPKSAEGRRRKEVRAMALVAPERSSDSTTIDRGPPVAPVPPWYYPLSGAEQEVAGTLERGRELIRQSTDMPDETREQLLDALYT